MNAPTAQTQRPGVSREIVRRLTYRAPYDWAHMRDFLAVRAIPGVERVDEQGYARTVRTADGWVVVRLRPADDADAIELSADRAADLELPVFERTARRVFDLDADPQAIVQAFAADPLLGPLVLHRPGLRIPGAWDPFECAVRAVLGQQVSVAACRTLVARVVLRAGEAIETSEQLTHLFPTPRSLAAANLDGLGVTGARIRALHALAHALTEGALHFALPVDDFTTRLATLPGFGAWTAQYIALRALRAPDAFPTGDLVLRKMAGGVKPLTARELELRAHDWRPWRGYAVMHLWRAAAERVSA